MRTISGILFFLGIGWALLAWMVALAPIGIFLPVYQYKAHDIAASLMAGSLAVMGYWVWRGWGLRWRTGQYPRVSGRAFWAISLLHHLLWAVVLPFLLETPVRKFWEEGYELPFRSWLVVNVVVALAGMIVEGGGKMTEGANADADADADADAGAVRGDDDGGEEAEGLVRAGVQAG